MHQRNELTRNSPGNARSRSVSEMVMSLWTDSWHSKSGTVARELISSNRSPGSGIVRRNFLLHSPRMRGAVGVGGGGGGGEGGNRRKGKKDEFFLPRSPFALSCTVLFKTPHTDISGKPQTYVGLASSN